jgi:hypothetical protein
MLILALILSIAGTAYCVWMEGHPPPVPRPAPTPVTVEVVLDVDEGDPPTIVQIRRG